MDSSLARSEEVQGGRDLGLTGGSAASAGVWQKAACLHQDRWQMCFRLRKTSFYKRREPPNMLYKRPQKEEREPVCEGERTDDRRTVKGL